MDPRAKRILITLLVLVAAVSIVTLMLTSGRKKPAPTPANTTPTTESAADDSISTGESSNDDTGPADSQAESVGTAPNGDDATNEPDASSIGDEESAESDAGAAPATTLSGFLARAPGDIPALDYDAASIGSVDPDQHRFRVDLTARGAAVSRITFADIWEHALDKQQAVQHDRAVAANDPNPPPNPDDSRRLILIEEQPIRRTLQSTEEPLPVLAAHSIIINGTRVHLYDFNKIGDERVHVWAETAPGRFETVITNAAGEDVLRIVREWSLRNNTYDLQLKQTVTNLTKSETLNIQWAQYGPPQLSIDNAPHRATYVDTRRFRFGYLLSTQVDPQRLAEVIAGDDMLYSWNQVSDRTESLWPNKYSRAENYELSWFASTSRYFALAVHPWYAGEGAVNRSLEDNVNLINHQVWISDTAKDQKYISTLLTSPARSLAPGAEEHFDFGVYAGPMEREVLYEREPYKTLNLGGLIFYQISTFCGFCTFQWLAHVLIWFLTVVHGVTADWALAIIILVLAVRFCLHPITKRAQVSMHRTMKRMAKFKPEMDKLQKKYGNDKKKMQVEQMRLMREHGVNPLGCLGFLPMLLQMPIWVALYAMLFFAYELRHEPAFWGFFQLFGDWKFLADLSQPDHFLGELSKPFQLLWMPVTGFNLLPFLMGAVMFVQQKYMTPPTAATMTKEQQQQQKIMRVLMVVMFPVMLYSAPSGLTLYIMTSSTVGIIESRMIRRHADHLEEMAEERRKRGDDDGPPWGEKDKKPRKPRDPRGRAYAKMLERMREGKKEPPRSFKKRK